MKRDSGVLTFKIFFAIIMTDVLESIAEIFFKWGTNTIGMDYITLSNVSEFILKVLASYGIWIGIFFYVLNFLLWITVLSKIDLSLAFPIGSTSYIFVPLLSMFLFGEDVNSLRWVGILSIIIGIYFISKSGPDKKDII